MIQNINNDENRLGIGVGVGADEVMLLYTRALPPVQQTKTADNNISRFFWVISVLEVQAYQKKSVRQV